MSIPIWMALPPEVHSALLSSGPGPGAMLAAAHAWHALSTHYAAAADELSTLVATTRADAWDGAGAEAYAAASTPYIGWLLQAATDAAATAAQQETAAGAYTAALAAMPTLAELAANHALHAALLATNFFGINTIPIALNEADYARMWIQAATTMSTYHQVSTTALAATPTTPPAPPVRKHGPLSAATDYFPGDPILNDWENVVQTVIDHLFGVTSPPYFDSLGTFPQGLTEFVADPSPALLAALVFAATFEVTFDTAFFSPASLLSTPLLPVAGLAGFAGLSGLAGIPHPEPLPDTAGELSQSPPIAVQPSVSPVAALVTPGPAAPAAVGTVTPPAPPASAPASPPSAPAAGVGFGYLVPGAGPDEEHGPTPTARSKAGAPSADIGAAATTAAPAAARHRSRRRRRGILRDHADEYLDIDADLDSTAAAPAVAAAAASDRGAGPLGHTATLPSTDRSRPHGLITVTGTFGTGPDQPQLPHTWADDPHSG
ncbi:PPE domain-containing protein [Mycobacterium sp.]|uniref:PPE domain-containing protein n=1 Tax=Mycobacterium sp. TaxID=1785 RepID=UPI0012812F32|nr:PPE domain-containing protein [Mycobacterium sp.]KAA8965449.1 MAG: PPE family protein [Mycobacterium sp.]